VENAKKARIKKSEIGYGYESIFPTQLRKLLERHGVTQETLARELCISRQSVAQWKDGKTMPDIYYLKKISDFFSVPYEYLLDGVESEKKENVDIGRSLGLSDDAIKTLSEINERNKATWQMDTLNKIIGNKDFGYLIAITTDYSTAAIMIPDKTLSGDRFPVGYNSYHSVRLMDILFNSMNNTFKDIVKEAVGARKEEMEGGRKGVSETEANKSAVTQYERSEIARKELGATIKTLSNEMIGILMAKDFTSSQMLAILDECKACIMDYSEFLLSRKG